MEVMNTILGGGGFNSTLVREIRSNRGLAYGAGSFYTFGADRGIFAAYGQTGVETTAQVVGLVRDIFQKTTSAPPSEKELNLAKESLLNQFVFKYDTPQGVVDQAALLDLRGFPPDFLGTYCDRIGKVTARDALEIAQKTIHPGKQTVLVVGPAHSLKEALKEFGEVEVVPLPEP
jgi:zinc protease